MTKNIYVEFAPAKLIQYLAGYVELAFNLGATEFQEKVWSALQDIPF